MGSAGDACVPWLAIARRSRRTVWMPRLSHNKLRTGSALAPVQRPAVHGVPFFQTCFPDRVPVFRENCCVASLLTAERYWQALASQLVLSQLLLFSRLGNIPPVQKTLPQKARNRSNLNTLKYSQASYRVGTPAFGRAKSGNALRLHPTCPHLPTRTLITPLYNPSFHFIFHFLFHLILHYSSFHFLLPLSLYNP